MTNQHTLSISRFLSRAQCHHRLWYYYHARDLAADPDDTLQAILGTGHEVGKLACKRYPGEHFVALDNRHFADALAEERKVLEEGTAHTLFEATFVHRGLLARATASLTARWH